MKRTGQPLSHESARGHVTGEALYTDDLVGRSEPVTMPAPAKQRACAPSISAQRSATTNSPSPCASIHPHAPA